MFKSPSVAEKAYDSPIKCTSLHFLGILSPFYCFLISMGIEFHIFSHYSFSSSDMYWWGISGSLFINEGAVNNHHQKNIKQSCTQLNWERKYLLMWSSCLFVAGKTDFLKEYGMELVEKCVDPVVIHHPKGHTIPRLGEFWNPESELLMRDSAPPSSLMYFCVLLIAFLPLLFTKRQLFLSFFQMKRVWKPCWASLTKFKTCY